MTAESHRSQLRACIDIPALPLQIILQKYPHWKEGPVAVIREDKPLAPILWTNLLAQKQHIRPGMSYSAALALSSGLRATSIASSEIEAQLQHLIRLFRKYSDRIEPSQQDPGTFWLSTVGLEQIYPSIKKWAHSLKTELNEQEFRASIVIGYTRFATYALARSLRPGILLLNSLQHEQRSVQSVRLEDLQLDLHLYRTLEKLGIQNLGQFLSLPPDEVRTRLGEDAHRIYQWAKGDLDQPLQAQTEVIPITRLLEFDFPETSKHRLLFILKKPVSELLAQLAREHQNLDLLHLGFEFESKSTLRTNIRPAEPTLDEHQIMDLLRLHLDTIEYNSGITRLELTVEVQSIKRKQLALFEAAERRDLQAGNRALARIRTEWGENSVVHASIKEGHLPEAQFFWTPLHELKRAQPALLDSGQAPPLIRRLYHKPLALSPKLRASRDESWLFKGHEQGTIISLEGPYILKGGWWLKPIHREYHFAATQHGRLLWVYYDRQRRRWFLHGEVE